MPVTTRDIQALVYLARRLRDETHGCRQWDEAGTFANLKAALAGQNLLISMQRVMGHATDPEAQTPGAIKRPFVPEAKVAVVREVFDEAETCAVCYERRAKCRELASHADDGHVFIAVDRNRSVASKKAPAEIRAAIAPTRTFPTRPTLATLAATAVAADEARGAATTEETQ
jgi:hypothetical protein